MPTRGERLDHSSSLEPFGNPLRPAAVFDEVRDNVCAAMNGQSLIEHKFYDGHNDFAPAMVSAADGYDPEGGWSSDRDNMTINATAHGPNSGLDCDGVSEASDFYEYGATPVDKSLEALVLAHAGRADALSWCP